MYRNYWYEDDVVQYTQSGQHPIIPEKYKYCKLYINNHLHKVKSFYTKINAEIALRHAIMHSYPSSDKYIIFRCNKCCMYHILSEKNYNLLIGESK